MAGPQQPALSDLGAVPSAANAPGPLVEQRKLMALGKFEEAERSLRAYLASDARSAQARYLLGYALLRQNKPKDSLEEYTRAAALQTPNAEQLREVGQSYVLLGDYPDAEKWFLRSLNLDDADPEGWYSLGRLRYTEQRFGDAADCFQRALVLATGNVKVENNLGLAYEGLNRTDDAVAAYRQAIAWQDAGPPGNVSEQPLLNLAIVLTHRGSLSEAQSLLTRAAAIAPRDPRIHEQLGQVLMQEGNYLEAEKHLTVATQLDPQQSSLHYLLGQAYRHLGRLQEAKAEFDIARPVQSIRPRHLFNTETRIISVDIFCNVPLVF
jgi:Flp pilus assembly protein TadD